MYNKIINSCFERDARIANPRKRRGNKILLIIPICIVNFGCQYNIQNKEANKQEVLDTISGCQSKEEIIPDSVINNTLKLSNYLSFETFYPEFRKISMVETIRNGSPIAVLSNVDQSEYLLAYKHDGDMKNSYSCFEIGYWCDEKLDTLTHYKTKYKEFITESGIKLGIPLDSLIMIKGNNYKIQEIGNVTFLIYEISDYEHSPFLKRYNMPDYFMKYKIKNDIVQQIMFGFDYP